MGRCGCVLLKQEALNRSWKSALPLFSTAAWCELGCRLFMAATLSVQLSGSGSVAINLEPGDSAPGSWFLSLSPWLSKLVFHAFLAGEKECSTYYTWFCLAWHLLLYEAPI